MSAEEQKVSINVKPIKLFNPFKFVRNIHPHTKVFLFGLSVPAAMLWIANWLAFEVAPVTGVLYRFYNSEYADAFRQELPARVETLASLGDNRGLAYIVFAIAFFILSFIFVRVAFARWNALGAKLGDVRAVSIAYSILIAIAFVAGFKLLLYVLQIDIGVLAQLISSLSPYLGNV